MLAGEPYMRGSAAATVQGPLLKPLLIHILLVVANKDGSSSRLQGCILSICPATLDLGNWIAAPAGSLLGCMRRHSAIIPAAAHRSNIRWGELMQKTIYQRSAVAWAGTLG